MKNFYYLFLLSFSSCTCGDANKFFDEANYRSITREKGTVMTKIGDSLLIYPGATILYSESNSSTLIILTKEKHKVYIQGPAVIDLGHYDFPY